MTKTRSVANTANTSGITPNQLSSGISSQKFDFLQSGTGAQTRTVESKLRDTFNVRDFGATGNGTTDDTVAIQNAIDSIPSSGGILFFPGGRYKVTSTLNIQNKCVSIQGVGSGQAESSTSGSFLVFTGIGSSNGLVFDNVDGHSISDIAIVGSSSSPPTGGYLVVYQGTSSGWYHVTWLNVMLAGGHNGAWFKNGFFYHAYSCIYKTFTGDQVLLLNGVSDSNDAQTLTFVNCNIAAETSTTTDLVVLDGFAASTKFHGCSLLFGRHGLVQKNSYGGKAPGFTYFSGGGFENGEGDAIRLEAGDHFLMSNAYVSTDANLGRLLYVGPAFGGEITLSGNYLRGGGRGGIWLEDGNTVISGNTIVNNNAPTTTTFSISNVTNSSGLIQVTTSSAHHFETDDLVTIKNVTGTTEANGTWVITKNSSTQFTLSVNANSDTGAPSSFSNPYISGGSAELATASIRILPTAGFVTVTGNNLGGASSGTRKTDYGIHTAAPNTISAANTTQLVDIAPYQSITNDRTSAARYNLGETSTGGYEPYQVDGSLVFSATGSTTSGTKQFNNLSFVTGCKIRIVRITRQLSSGSGNIVSAQVLANGSPVGSSYSQNGSVTTDTLLSAPIIIDGTTTPVKLELQLSTTGTPLDYVFQAQYQLLS